MIKKLSELKLNPKNPRFIKDEKYEKLKRSIQDFPQMLDLRKIVVDEDFVILGGNMRYRAMKELGFKETDVIVAKGLSEEQKDEFIIKDNVGFGDWDWDLLANEWNIEELTMWGLDVFKPSEDVDLDRFFEDHGHSDKDQPFKIVLEYTEEEYNKVLEQFKLREGSKEKIVYTLLGL